MTAHHRSTRHGDHPTLNLSASDEAWAPISNFPGYELSTRGRARSFVRTAGRNGGRYYSDTPKLIGMNSYRGKYRTVSIYDTAGKKHTLPIHILMLETFIGRRPEGMIACHLDDDADHNWIENLRWDTPSANQCDRVRLGSNHLVKLNIKDIPDIWKRLVNGESHTSIAKDYKVGPSNIGAIANGRSWRHVTSTLTGWPLRPPDDPNAKPIYVPPEYCDPGVEIWRVIPEWDAYRISNLGNAESCYSPGGSNTKTTCWSPRKLNYNESRYLMFGAWDKGRHTMLYPHRLVLTLFACPKPKGMVACHSDGVRDNNFAGNLRWDTLKANSRDRFRHEAERESARIG
jgi:hypothetical protein